MLTKKFDYESKTWGLSEVRLSPFYLGALKLKRSIDDLREVKGKVLDIGCGAGGMSRAIKFYRPDLEVFGVDVSKSSISQAQRNSGGVKFSLGDIYKLPFKSEEFDAVVVFDVLEHLDKPSAALEEVSRVLKKGGVFSLQTPIEGNIFSIHGLAEAMFGFTPLRDYGGHIQQFKFSQVKALLEKSHFTIDGKKYFGHFFNQIVDFSYFTFLNIRGRNVRYSVEGFVHASEGLSRIPLLIMKSIVAVVSYFESDILWFFPAASSVHIEARKT
jgi:ubiquinone/menaquinone biosynthesis C-methylase UbiE